MPRWYVVRIVFLGIVLLALPVAAYHFASGRFPQGVMALGGAAIGLALALSDLARGPSAEEIERARRPPVARSAPRRALVWTPPDHMRLDGWMRNGLLSGFVATMAMGLALVAGYVIVVGLGQRDSGLIGQWFWNLAHNPLTAAVSGGPILALVIQIVLGLVFGVMYAGVVESHLPGPGWARGVVFTLGLWLLSVLVFFPLVGAGVLGLGLGAGPLPTLGNLVVHLVYGVTLGTVYAIPETSGVSAGEADLAANIRVDRFAAAGIVAGGILGIVVGTLIQVLVGQTAALPANWLLLGACLIGGAWGGLVGSMAGLSSGHPAPEPPGATAPVRHLHH